MKEVIRMFCQKLSRLAYYLKKNIRVDIIILYVALDIMFLLYIAQFFYTYSLKVQIFELKSILI